MRASILMCLVVAICLLSAHVFAKGKRAKRGRGKPQRIGCVDGDKRCDHDAVKNGSCRFYMRVCFNSLGGSGLSRGVASCKLQNAPLGRRRHNDDIAALQAAIDGLGLPRLDRACTRPESVTVPLTAHGYLLGQLKVVLRSKGTNRYREVRRLQLVCQP